jgi:hypothetical protein
MVMLKRIAPALALGAALMISGCGGSGGQTTAASSSSRHTVAAVSFGIGGGERAQEDPDGPGRRRKPAQPTWTFTARLPARTTAGQRLSRSTVVTISMKGNRVCWRFGRTPQVTVSTAAFGHVHSLLRPTGASVNAGPRGRTGPALIPLGVRFAPAGCTSAAPVVINSVAAAPALYYLNLTASQFPAVTVRGQLSHLTRGQHVRQKRAR